MHTHTTSNTNTNSKNKYPGRPRTCDPRDLQEAAFELFAINGYDRTTVSMIASTAGYSRATFFKYFKVKSDVFWLEVDQLLDKFAKYLSKQKAQANLFTEVIDCANITLKLHPPQVPWVFTNHELIGNPHDIYGSAAARVERLNSIISDFLRTKSQLYMFANAKQKVAQPHAVHQLLANCLSAIFITAIMQWAKAAPDRDSLHSYIAEATQQLRAEFTTQNR